MPDTTVNVRYIVDDVEASLAFYTTQGGRAGHVRFCAGQARPCRIGCGRE